MDRSRWVSLGVVVVYVAVCALALVWSEGGTGAPRGEGFGVERVGFVLLFLGFASIWWSEALGGALWTGRGAWNPKPSSEGAVTLLGWIFMALAIAVPVIARLRPD